MIRCPRGKGPRGVVLTLTQREEAARLIPRVNRDPCPYCNVRADIGCEHDPRPIVVARFG